MVFFVEDFGGCCYLLYIFWFDVFVGVGGVVVFDFVLVDDGYCFEVVMRMLVYVVVLLCGGEISRFGVV